VQDAAEAQPDAEKSRSAPANRIARASPKRAPNRASQQPELDPGKLVFIDETWTKTT
jgi:hypothetical protein